jgi:SAM-dependent methyltransferase
VLIAEALGKALRSWRRNGLRATVRRSLEEIAHRLRREPDSPPATSSAPATAPAESEQHALWRILGIEVDPGYATIREALRQEAIGRLVGFAPVGAPPDEMFGYLNEAALRFGETIRWIAAVVEAELGGESFSILETGSNPYFLTALVKERFPGVRHMGLNYFGNPNEVGTFQTQEVVDPFSRLTESTYLYADIERHSLDAVGLFDVCLFCEVIEHLPFDPAWALFNLARQVRDGGHMILTTPNPARLENIQRLVFHGGSFSDQISGYGIHGRHNREYAMSELLDLLTGTGFTVVRSRSLDVVPTPWSRSAEERGFGQYLVVDARLEGRPRLYRPAWLYRSFSADRLSRTGPLIDSASD